MTKQLETGIYNVRNVGRYIFQENALDFLPQILESRPDINIGSAIFIVDEFFQQDTDLVGRLPIRDVDSIFFVPTKDEPTTEYINALYSKVVNAGRRNIKAIVGIGGGATLDTAKAVSNLLGNGGRAEDYQGWDLLTKPGVYKVGVPTISGTGAEATRTCVMTSKKTGLKLGMNSDFSLYDQLLLDPTLTKTVPREQYFFTGMDAYIHCAESLAGFYRNSIGDALSEKSLKLCQDVFMSDDMMTEECRAKLMVASYLGGCAIATSYVGIVHPFSAGLSVALGLHHGVANCIALNGLKNFYGAAQEELVAMTEKQNVVIPQSVCSGLGGDDLDRLYDATIIHEKPLINALGPDFRDILTRDRVINLFSQM